MAGPADAVNVASKFDQIGDMWSPRIAAEFNGLHVKLARGQGEFMWHTHKETDEFFWIHRGAVEIQMRDRPSVQLTAGDVFVVPAGVEHRPVATGECEIVFIEPAHTPNTGDVATATQEEWI